MSLVARVEVEQRRVLHSITPDLLARAVFQNMIFAINRMQNNDKMDHFMWRVKYNVCVNRLKAQCDPFEKHLHISQNVTTTICRVC